MKKIKNLLTLIVFSFTIFAMNFTLSSLDEKRNVEIINQLEFVSEELSDVQEELNTINGFSVLANY